MTWISLLLADQAHPPWGLDIESSGSLDPALIESIALCIGHRCRSVSCQRFSWLQTRKAKNRSILLAEDEEG
jgi:hypothetical protein